MLIVKLDVCFPLEHVIVNTLCDGYVQTETVYEINKINRKDKWLYNAVSNSPDCSKRRRVQSNTISASL